MIIRNQGRSANAFGDDSSKCNLINTAESRKIQVCRILLQLWILKYQFLLL